MLSNPNFLFKELAALIPFDWQNRQGRVTVGTTLSGGPRQIRTGAASAYGSYLGQKRQTAVRAPGLWMRAGGSQVCASFFTRSQLSRVFWLRRRRVLYHSRVHWVRNAPNAFRFPGMAWYPQKPLMTETSHFPCSFRGSCIRSRSAALTS